VNGTSECRQRKKYGEFERICFGRTARCSRPGPFLARPHTLRRGQGLGLGPTGARWPGLLASARWSPRPLDPAAAPVRALVPAHTPPSPTSHVSDMSTKCPGITGGGARAAGADAPGTLGYRGRGLQCAKPQPMHCTPGVRPRPAAFRSRARVSASPPPLGTCSPVCGAERARPGRDSMEFPRRHVGANCHRPFPALPFPPPRRVPPCALLSRLLACHAVRLGQGRGVSPLGVHMATPC